MGKSIRVGIVPGHSIGVVSRHNLVRGPGSPHPLVNRSRIDIGLAGALGRSGCTFVDQGIHNYLFPGGGDRGTGIGTVTVVDTVGWPQSARLGYPRPVGAVSPQVIVGRDLDGDVVRP